MSLFAAINDGSDRLRLGEDAAIWRMRGEGRAWPEIAAALIAARHAKAATMSARMARYHARRWRDAIRQERASA